MIKHLVWNERIVGLAGCFINVMMKAHVISVEVLETEAPNMSCLNSTSTSRQRHSISLPLKYKKQSDSTAAAVRADHNQCDVPLRGGSHLHEPCAARPIDPAALCCDLY